MPDVNGLRVRLCALGAGLLSALASLSAASDATGRTVAVNALAGPDLAGDEVVYARAERRQLAVRSAPHAGGASKVLGRISALRPGAPRPDAALGFVGRDRYELAASPAGAAVAATSGVFVPESGDVGYSGTESIHLARRGAAFERLFSCSYETPGVLPGTSVLIEQSLAAVAIDGNLVATVEGCLGKHWESAPTPARVLVRDLASGEQAREVARVEAHDIIDRVRLAGRYMVVRRTAGPPEGPDRTELLLVDLAAGTVVLTVEPEGWGVALQEDGTVVFPWRSQSCGGRPGVAWVSPADPTIHPLPVCGTPLAIGRNLILVGRGGARRGEVIVVDLSGARRASMSFAVPGPGAFWPEGDFDGARVTVGLPDCLRDGATVRIAAFDVMRLPARAPALRCRLGALRRGVLRPTTRGLVRLEPRCPAGCHIVVARLRSAQGRALTGKVSVALGAGERGFSMRLRRSTRRLLARRGRLRAVLEVVYHDGRRIVKARRNVTIAAKR